MKEVERRYTRGQVQLRAADGPPKIGGYAAKFNKRSQNLGGFVEDIHRTFFNKSAGDGWPGVMARYNHDNNMLLGTIAGGTLRLALDEEGLDYEVDPPSHRADVVELVTRGDVHQSSFAFQVFEDDWSMTEQGFPLRTLISGALVDVAPVNSPAYLDTSTGLRSLAERAGAELAEVEAAAAAGKLGTLLEPRKMILDLASWPVEDLTKSSADSSGQGDTHPPLSVRRRQAELQARRTF